MGKILKGGKKGYIIYQMLQYVFTITDIISWIYWNLNKTFGIR